MTRGLYIFTGVLSLDLEGRVTNLNHAAEEMLGLSSGEAVGRHYREVFRDPSMLPVADSLDEICRSVSGSWERSSSVAYKRRAADTD